MKQRNLPKINSVFQIELLYFIMLLLFHKKQKKLHSVESTWNGSNLFEKCCCWILKAQFENKISENMCVTDPYSPV